MNNQKLTELVKKAQAGDKKALNDLVAQCYGDIYYYILKTVKSNDIAEDVTQESFVEITTTLNSLREPAAFNVWARRIAYHKCAVHFRGTKEVLLDEDEDGETLFDRLPDESDSSLPEKVMEDKEFCKTVLDMINSLPSEQANALLLYYYEKMSIKQIATIQDTTEGTVKSRLNYARKAVKGKVEEYEKKTGTRLHSVAILPLLLRFVYKSEKASMPAVSAPTAVTAITATTAAKVGTGALVAKIAAGVLAATVAIGGIGFGVSKLIKNRNQSGATESDGEVVISNEHGVNGGKNPFIDEKPEEAIFPLIGTWRQIQPDKEKTVHSFVIDKDRNLIKDGVVYPLSDIESNEEGEYTLYYGEDSYEFELENGKYYYRDYQDNITEYTFNPSYYRDYMYIKEEDYVDYDVIELTPENILVISK